MKGKTGNKFMQRLLLGFGIYLLAIVALMTLLSGEDNRAIASDNFDKTSIDNTPEFILTNKSNGCRYVYDSVQKTSHVAMGYEQCDPLH